MMTLVLERLLRRERAIVFAALASLTVLAWIYFVWLSRESSLMPDVNRDIPEMAASGLLRAWTVAEFFVVFAMWSSMMVGMMTPSIAPAILTYARFSRHPVTRNAPLAPIGWFVGGYLIAWLGFAFIVSVVQAAFLEVGLIAPTLRSSSDVVGGIVFIFAGGYQLSLLKDTCLSYCRSPLNFINDQGGFRPSAAAAVKLGLRHGLYCVGCCWALMAILFAVGVMEPLWIAVISIWILLEKIFPVPGVMTRASGFLLIAAGTALLIKNAV